MRVFLETFGCQMNELDSQVIRSILDESSEFIDDPERAQIVLLNTCAVRENAHNKVYQRLNDFKKAKKNGKIRVIGVLGCMSQSLRHILSEQAPFVDIVVGPDAYKKLPDLINAALTGKERGYEFSRAGGETYQDIVPKRLPGVNAWIAIMRGCDNFCTFCVVPHTRGRERSIPPEIIITETQNIIEQGYQQLSLLGQNVNSYNYQSCDFSDLMEKIARLAIARVRFTSPHPKDFSRKLLDIMATHRNLCKHIHLPLQAGSNQVLKRMGRNYTRDEFLALVDEIRTALPGVSLTTDVICGFCEESDSDFLQTMEMIERVEFDSAFIFKYSERNNTIASRKYLDNVPEQVKSQRVTALNTLQREISLRRNHAEIGMVFEVLIEQPSKKDPQQWFGRTDHNKGVVFTAVNNEPGDFVQVLVVDAGTNTLLGELK